MKLVLNDLLLVDCMDDGLCAYNAILQSCNVLALADVAPTWSLTAQLLSNQTPW